MKRKTSSPWRRFMREYLQYLVPLILLGIAFLVASGCSGHSGPSANQATETSASDPLSQWAIHVDVGEAGSQVRVDLSPARTAGHAQTSSDGVNEQALQQDAITGPGLRTAGVVVVDDAGASFDQYDEANPTVVKDAWLLLWGAASQCRLGARETSGTPPQLANAHTVIPPWSTVEDSAPWYIFNTKAQTCDQLLAMNEALLCVASALRDVSDAVAPLYWDGPALQDPPVDGFPKGPLI